MTTVTVHLASTSPALATIVTVPTFLASIFPFSSTVAIFSSDDVNTTSLSTIYSGNTVAIILSVCPTCNSILVLSNTIDSASISGTISPSIAPYRVFILTTSVLKVGFQSLA